MIKEDIEFMGPVRLKDVSPAEDRNVIRKLEDAGEIIISEAEATKSLFNVYGSSNIYKNIRSTWGTPTR